MPKAISGPEWTAYMKRHDRCVAARGKASAHSCEECGKQAKEWAWIHDTDGETPENYKPMCHGCHQRYDDRWNQEERDKVSASLKKYHANMTAEQRAERGRRISEGKLRGYPARVRKGGDA